MTPAAARSDSPSAPPPYPPDAGSAEIRDDIRRTRADMDETVDALGERLRPRHLLDDFLDIFRGSGGSGSGAGDAAGKAKDKAMEYGSSVLRGLKNHPVPAALIGAGVAWLIVDQMSDGGPSRSDVRGRWRDGELREHSGSFVDARTGQPYDAAYGADYGRTQSGGEGGGGGPGMMDKAKEKAGQIGQSVSGAAGAAKEKIAGAASGIGSAASGAASAASDYGRQTADWSSQTYDDAREGLRRGYESGRQTFEEALNEYPLAVGAAALAAGVLTGLLLPGTRREDELMGEQAERLKDQAKDAGQEMWQRGKEVAGAATGAMADEARQEGLAPGQLGEKVKHVAQEVTGAAKQSARREGLDDLAGKAKSVLDRGKEAAKDEASRQKEQVQKPGA